MGRLTIHTKLPIGMGVTLVAIPQSTPDTVTFSIPFDQIKGDRTGGMAKFIARVFWCCRRRRRSEPGAIKRR